MLDSSNKQERLSFSEKYEESELRIFVLFKLMISNHNLKNEFKRAVMRNFISRDTDSRFLLCHSLPYRQLETGLVLAFPNLEMETGSFLFPFYVIKNQLRRGGF